MINDKETPKPETNTTVANPVDVFVMPEFTDINGASRDILDLEWEKVRNHQDLDKVISSLEFTVSVLSGTGSVRDDTHLKKFHDAYDNLFPLYAVKRKILTRRAELVQAYSKLSEA